MVLGAPFDFVGGVWPALSSAGRHAGAHASAHQGAAGVGQSGGNIGSVGFGAALRRRCALGFRVTELLV